MTDFNNILQKLCEGKTQTYTTKLQMKDYDNDLIDPEVEVTYTASKGFPGSRETPKELPEIDIKKIVIVDSGKKIDMEEIPKHALQDLIDEISNNE